MQGALVGMAHRVRGGEAPSPGEAPPTKRPCGPSDPFADEMNLTDADLEHLDLLASQAFSQLPQEVAPGRRASQGDARPAPAVAPAVAPASYPTLPAPGSRRVQEAQLRDAQSLRDKCARLQEEVYTRQGEARVLRQSLLGVQAALDEQRAERLRQERDATLSAGQRERDLHKQVEGLKAQLQFKEAEMEALRSRLHVLERGARSPRSPWGGAGLTAGSPRIGTSLARADSPLGQGPRAAAAEEKKEAKDCGQSRASDDVCDTWVMKRQWSQGALLVDKLLRVPGVCACLPVSSTARKGGGTASTDAANRGGPGDLTSALALTLNGLSQLLRPPGPPGRLGEPQASGPPGPCGVAGADRPEPGIVGREAETLSRFLPLVELRLGRYADAARLASRSGTGEEPAAVAVETGAEAATASDVPVAVAEEEAEAALRTLLALLAGAPAAVAEQLSSSPRQPGEPGSPHPLLRRLVQALEPCVDGTGRAGAGGGGPPGHPGRGRREAILRAVLRVLAQLAEPRRGVPAESLLLALEGSGRLARCVTAETPPDTVLQVTRILAALCCQPRALVRLGCGSDLCPLLHVCTYVCKRGRRGSKLHPDAWLRLQMQLARVVGAMAEAVPVRQLLDSPCACSLEVAKALALSLHRAWLSVRGPARHAGDAARRAAPRTGRAMRELVWGLSALSAGDGRLWGHLQDAAHPLVEATRCLRSGLLLQSLLPAYGPADEAALEGLCYNPHVTGEQHSDVVDMEVT